ncbi:hypothetical protein [Planktotalea sp.]|uniref:hypothetical protein n=1 Tax=Planktotalea sp. TaxID=2029877 RepID=UPI003D6C4802
MSEFPKTAYKSARLRSIPHFLCNRGKAEHLMRLRRGTKERIGTDFSFAEFKGEAITYSAETAHFLKNTTIETKATSCNAKHVNGSRQAVEFNGVGDQSVA